MFANVAGTKVHRAAQIKQKPGGDLPIFLKLAYMRHLQTGRDVPVDISNIVIRLIFAQVRQIKTKAAEQGPIIAVKQTIKSLDDSPFESTQQGFRIRPLESSRLQPFRQRGRPPRSSATLEIATLRVVALRVAVGSSVGGVCAGLRSRRNPNMALERFFRGRDCLQDPHDQLVGRQPVGQCVIRKDQPMPQECPEPGR